MVSRYRVALSLGLLCLVGLLAPVGLALSHGPNCPPAVSPAGALEPPRLAVLVVFDQMRADYLSRWADLFGERGFRRLQKDGAWYTNCHYPYAATWTAVGHASILAGCSPAEHGIISNEWYDRASRDEVGSVATSRYKRVFSTSIADSEPSNQKDKAGASPERLLVPSLGDALKDATGGTSRVVGLSLKDRSAVLPAGHHPDACYWMDTGDGQFVTSTYYRDRSHPWVEEFNRAQPADQWFGRSWERFRPELDYVRYGGPDDVVGEGKGFNQGRCFPHPMTGGLSKPGMLYYQALINSPFGNELLLELVKRAIDHEHLGRRDVPDLLTVSFSCNDYIGHCWGPDSQEMLDVTLRSDQIVERLLEHLDTRVGKGRYVLVLTADHGVCPLPEVSRARSQEALRVPADTVGSRAEAFLNQSFGQGQEMERWLEAQSYQWLYLNQRYLAKRGLKQAEVDEALAGWLKRQPGVLTAYTRTQLLAGVPADDTIATRVQRSFHPQRSGDVAVILKPYHLLSTPLGTGTTHGTPHSYDTHVPFLVYGPGVKPGNRTGEVVPQAAATILARAVGIKPPASAKFPVPEGLFTAP